MGKTWVAQEVAALLCKSRKVTNYLQYNCADIGSLDLDLLKDASQEKAYVMVIDDANAKALTDLDDFLGKESKRLSNSLIFVTSELTSDDVKKFASLEEGIVAMKGFSEHDETARLFRRFAKEKQLLGSIYEKFGPLPLHLDIAAKLLQV